MPTTDDAAAKHTDVPGDLLAPEPQHHLRSDEEEMESLPARGGRAQEAFGHIVWPVLGFLALIAIWEIIVLVAGIARDILPAPATVAGDLASQWPLLAHNALATLKEILLGFALAVLIGVPIAMGVAFSRTLERLLYPLIVVSQAIPKIVVAPLLILWFGFGMTSNLLVAMLVAVFPIIVNTALGLTEIDPDVLRLAKVMGGSSSRTFRKIRLPAALPSTFAGLKMAITFATLGAVAGELVAGQSGLGYVVNFASGNDNAGLSFASIIVLSVIGVALFYLVVLAERLTIRWRPTR